MSGRLILTADINDDHGYVLLIANTFHDSWRITVFVTKLTRRVSLVKQKLRTLPDHMSSPPVFSGVHVTWSLVLFACYVDRCLSFCIFSFGHGVVCSSSIYGFWLSRWYLQNPPTLRELELENYDLLYFLFNHVCFAHVFPTHQCIISPTLQC